VNDAKPVGAFLTAASPGIISYFLINEYYKDDDEYMDALCVVMRDEYEAIAAAGFDLQIDCPDLAGSRHNQFLHLTTPEFRDVVVRHIEVLNEATKNIAPERMRMHVCWGNYEGPHHLDIPLREIVDLLFKARPSMISFEGANPRHEHEWNIWQDIKLPEGKVLIPGVIDSTTNFIEHPELVSQRILRYAELVGRENVIAGVDCGLGNGSPSSRIDRRIAWAKLEALVEGARMASEVLW
jgi:5-methyltetrahydropteroyltriglutamate--homocysteine methyltransferase